MPARWPDPPRIVGVAWHLTVRIENRGWFGCIEQAVDAPEGGPTVTTRRCTGEALFPPTPAEGATGSGEDVFRDKALSPVHRRDRDGGAPRVRLRLLQYTNQPAVLDSDRQGAGQLPPILGGSGPSRRIVPGHNIFTTDLDSRASPSRRPLDRAGDVAAQASGHHRHRRGGAGKPRARAIGTDLYLRRERELFKKPEPQDPYDLPVVTGSLGGYRQERGEAWPRSNALSSCVRLRTRGLARSRPVQEVHIEDTARSCSPLERARLLRLGKGPFRQGLEQASRVLAELSSRGADPSIVFLDNGRQPSGWW